MTEMCTDTFNWQQYCIVSFWASGAVAGSMLLGSSQRRLESTHVMQKSPSANSAFSMGIA